MKTVNDFLKNKKIIILSILLFLLIPISCLLAAPIIFEQQVNIPGFESGEIQGTSIAKYISAFYKWSVIAVAVLAVLAIVNAGLGMIMAGGNAAKVVEKRNDLFNAIIGLILVLAAVPMLNLINPVLVRLSEIKILGIEKIEKIEKTEDDNLLVSDPSLVCADRAKHSCGDVYRQVIEGREITCCGTRCSEGYVCASVTGGDPLGGKICPPGTFVYRVCQLNLSNAPQCNDEKCFLERICSATCCTGQMVVPCYCPEGKRCPCDECNPSKVCQGKMCE